MDVIRHDTPDEEPGVSVSGGVVENVDKFICESTVVAEPSITSVGSYRYEEAVTLAVARTRQSDLSSDGKTIVRITHLGRLAGGDKPRPYLAVSNRQRFSGVRPLEGLGERSVEIVYEGDQLLTQIVDG